MLRILERGERFSSAGANSAASGTTGWAFASVNCITNNASQTSIINTMWRIVSRYCGGVNAVVLRSAREPGNDLGRPSNLVLN